MELIISALLCLLFCRENSALMPPTVGECHESFMDIYPPQMMKTWYVMKHTDSLLLPPGFNDCLIMKFGRRMSFNSQIRMDIIHSTEADETDDSQPPIRGEVTVPGKEPFGVHIQSSIMFPVNIMVTHLDENNDCMAFWSCAELAPSLIQKGAWILCKSTDVNQDLIEDLVQKVSNASDIEPNFFISTKYEKCL